MNKNFFALISIILAALVYPFFISPLWDEVQTRRNDEAQVIDAQKSVDSFIELRNELVRKTEAFSQADIDRLAQLLPESINALGIVVDIENIARQNGFILRGAINVEEPDDNEGALGPDGTPLPRPPYDATLFTMNVVGPYSSLKPFLETLAQSLTLFDVAAVSFTTSDTGVYDFMITIRTYSLPQP